MIPIAAHFRMRPDGVGAIVLPSGKELPVFTKKIGRIIVDSLLEQKTIDAAEAEFLRTEITASSLPDMIEKPMIIFEVRRPGHIEETPALPSVPSIPLPNQPLMAS